MKTPRFWVLTTLLLTALFFACKQGEIPAEEAAAPGELSAIQTDSISQNTLKPLNQRPLVRTADLKGKVKNVAQSTEIIENATRRLGGYVVQSHLHSNIIETGQVKISRDSTLKTTRFNVENTIKIRVPNKQLDTLVQAISREVCFLDSRNLDQNDVSLDVLRNQKTVARQEKKQQRLTTAIDQKGKKLNQVVAAEDHLETTQSEVDEAQINQWSLKDQVAYSTISIQLYQDETVASNVIATIKPIDDYHPAFGVQLLESVQTGWFILEGILAFIVQLWSLMVLGILGVWLFQKFRIKNDKKLHPSS